MHFRALFVIPSNCTMSCSLVYRVLLYAQGSEVISVEHCTVTACMGVKVNPVEV